MIIQPSLIRPPDIDWYLDVYNYVRPWTLWRTKDLSGARVIAGEPVPYHFRKHKLTMPSGEDAQVLLMEYIQGKMLEQWLEDRPVHNNIKPEDLRFGGCQREICRRDEADVLLGVHAFNELGTMTCVQGISSSLPLENPWSSTLLWRAATATQLTYGIASKTLPWRLALFDIVVTNTKRKLPSRSGTWAKPSLWARC